MADTPERPAEIPQPVPMPEGGAMAGGQQETAPQTERPETYLEKLERHGAQVTPSAPQPVHDDQGQQLTQPTPTNVTTVNIPANQVQLLEWAKGPEDKAITWLSRYWIRLIKKSVHFGWKLIMPPPPQPVQQNTTAPVQQMQPNSNVPVPVQ